MRTDGQKGRKRETDIGEGSRSIFVTPMNGINGVSDSVYVYNKQKINALKPKIDCIVFKNSVASQINTTPHHN
jgi:hypothetical protein